MTIAINPTRQGWQYFECEHCEKKWRETTRDYQSHSMAACPLCQNIEDVITGEPDATVRVDKSGNLAEPMRVEFLE